MKLVNQIPIQYLHLLAAYGGRAEGRHLALLLLLHHPGPGLHAHVEVHLVVGESDAAGPHLARCRNVSCPGSDQKRTRLLSFFHTNDR